jgi:hypothetical protein
MNIEIQITILKKPVLFFLAYLIFFAGCKSTSNAGKENTLLQENFKNPPVENRPLALWAWLNGYVDTARLVYELEEMKDKGMRGAFIWDVGALADKEKMIPAGPEFLGRESLQYISLSLNHAKRLGLEMGLFASSSWNAGGPWIDEANASKELLSVTQTVIGPTEKKITIGAPKLSSTDARAYTLITSIALPHSEAKEIDYSNIGAINLDQLTSANNIIDWKIPEGKWDVISFFMANTGQKLECPSPNSDGLIIDHLSRRATKRDFDTMLTKLSTVLTPEHQLKFLELDSYEVWEARDWTPDFAEQFKKRYGYDLKPFLPILKGYKSKDSVIGKRFLGDYNRLVSDMIIDNHFGQAMEIANKNKMELYSEAGHGGYARVDPLKALGNSDVPMGEFWNRQRFWVTKEAASAAHIYGRKLVAAESLTGWQNWQHGPADFKQLLDIAFCAGLNQVVFHNFAHSPAIAGKPGFVYHAGEHINVNTSWWEMARPFMDYLGRCSYMLRQGNFIGDICVYYGDDAPNQVPSRRIDPNIVPKYPESACQHCGVPKPVDPGKLDGYDYDYINSDVISNKMKTENGKLVLSSGQNYKMMLLPDREDISPEVLKKLEKLIYDGAIVIGRKPTRSNSLKNYPLCDNEVAAIADKIWGKCDGKNTLSNNYGKGKVYWGKSVHEVLNEYRIRPDFEVKGIDNTHRHIDYIHQQTDAEDIYFVSNSATEKNKVTCIFRVDQDRVPELWDPETGLIQRQLEFKKVDGGISIDLFMDPLASRFVVFKNKTMGVNDPGLSYDLQFGFGSNIDQKETNNRTENISYNWNVKFNPSMGGPSSHRLDSLISWSDISNSGIKYYSGSATYEKEYTLSANAHSTYTNAFLVFNDIQEMVRISVNGKDCGIIWTPPYKADITSQLKAGNNKITVQVINAWNNRIVGDLNNPSEKYTNTNIRNRFKVDGPLLKSGLIGKAQILFVNKPQ